MNLLISVLEFLEKKEMTMESTHGMRKASIRSYANDLPNYYHDISLSAAWSPVFVTAPRHARPKKYTQYSTTGLLDQEHVGMFYTTKIENTQDFK